ncbi:MAG: hypothetical protein ACRD9Q_02130 [Nitrososphaeraceae archaeon]
MISRLIISILVICVIIPVYSQQSAEPIAETNAESPYIIVAYISAGGVIGALIFNGLTHLKDKKSRYYQAFKDLEEERTKIQEPYAEFHELEWSTNAELEKMHGMLKNPAVDKVKTYRWKHIQFHDKVAHLALSGIVSKEIARYFNDTFPYALAYIPLTPNPEEIRKLSPNLVSWCDKEGISAYVAKTEKAPI